MRGYRQTPKARRIKKEPSPYARLYLALGMTLSLLATGTIGYMIVEGWSLLDSLYMTVITFSTVGYGEVRPMDVHGKILSMALILFGGGMAAWALLSSFEVLVSDQSRRFLQTRRIRKQVKGMKNHFIVCGYGRIGQAIVAGYIQNRIPFVVLEMYGPRVEQLRNEGIPHIDGDASTDSVLESAGIHEARALIAVTPADAVNTFICLSARGLSKSVTIVARSDSVDAVPKLYRAGANKVISPHVLGGWWMSMTAINPAATDFIEGLSLADHSKTVLYEFSVGSELDGLKIGGQEFRRRSGALVVAARRGEDFFANPPDDLTLHTGDGLIAIGSPDELKKLAKICNPSNPTVLDLPLNT